MEHHSPSTDFERSNTVKNLDPETSTYCVLRKIRICKIKEFKVWLQFINNLLPAKTRISHKAIFLFSKFWVSTSFYIGGEDPVINFHLAIDTMEPMEPISRVIPLKILLKKSMANLIISQSLKVFELVLFSFIAVNSLN